MAHFSDDQNYDEFMNTSSEEWSKPEKPPERPTPKVEPTDRWGSPVPEKSAPKDVSRQGSEPAQPSTPGVGPEQKKGSSNWWIILIVIVLVLCLCVCLVAFGLPLLGINWGLDLLPDNLLML